MSHRIITTRHLGEALKAEDYPLPDGCREVRMVMGINTPFLLQFDVMPSGDNLAKLGRAFVRLAEYQSEGPVP
jgi:hypothetical protein